MFKPIDLPTLHKLQDAAKRTRDMIHARAIREFCLAFGREPGRDARLDMCVIHNSIISAKDGRPWAEVNYSHMRKAAWLCERSHIPGRIVSEWYNRKTRA